MVGPKGKTPGTDALERHTDDTDWEPQGLKIYVRRLPCALRGARAERSPATAPDSSWGIMAFLEVEKHVHAAWSIQVWA